MKYTLSEVNTDVIGNQLIVLNTHSGACYLFNSTSSFIFSELQKNTSLNDLIRQFQDRYQLDRTAAEFDVLYIIRLLEEFDLICTIPDSTNTR